MEKKRIKNILPSLICTDLCNIEKSVSSIKDAGFNMIHIDILDGHFSPSMPIGLDSISQLRAKTKLGFDVHLMTNRNDFFIDEMIKIGCERLCFHYESEDHVDLLIRKIKENGIKVGIALKPATSIMVLDEFLNELDFILLMLINPGYASSKHEEQVPYAEKKIRRCKTQIDLCKKPISIEVDGRIGFDNLNQLLDAGANYFVAGTTTIFKNRTLINENVEKMEKIIGNWNKNHE